MEKFLESLKETEKIIFKIDHLVYITFPLVKDKRLLLKAITEVKTAIANCINAILQYEYLYKRIRLSQDPQTNFKIFRERCAERYEISEKEINLIIELFDFVKRHQQSHFEFVKEEKIVILSENMKQKILTSEKVKEFLVLTKNILKKTNSQILR